MQSTRLLLALLLTAVAALVIGACSSDEQTVPEPSHLDGLAFDGDRVLTSAAVDSLNVSLVDDPTVTRPSELAATLGDTATPLFRANITGQSTAPLSHHDTEVAVQVRQFASIDDAFGYYASIRPENLTGVEMGTEGFRRGDSLIFTRGAYVARLYPTTSDTSAAVDSVAKAIDLAIGGMAGLPTTFILFPFSGKVHGSDQFTAYDYLGFPGVERVYSTDYVAGGDTVTLFLTQDPEKNKWVAMLEGAEDIGDVGEAPPLFNYDPGYAITFDHPDHGAIVVGYVRGKVVGLIGPGRDTGHQLLSRWVRGLQ